MEVERRCQPGGTNRWQNDQKNPPRSILYPAPPSLHRAEGQSLSPARQPENIHYELLSYGSRNTKVILKSTKKCSFPGALYVKITQVKRLGWPQETGAETDTLQYFISDPLVRQHVFSHLVTS